MPPDADLASMARQLQAMDQHRDVDLLRAYEERQRRHPNPLVRFGAKCFSQADEDGLTLEIIRRIGLSQGRFAEFGVGDGMQNNTLILAAMGWHGFWVGNADLAFDPTSSARLTYTKAWITADTIVDHFRAGSAAGPVDVVSLDLDSNDYHMVQALLQDGAAPALFIVEYNAKFPPPVRFVIRHDPAQVWGRDDYFGASLQSFADLFGAHGYRLVCCNAATGVNAFFVRDAFAGLFPEVPADIRQVFVGPHYHLLRRHGHAQSVRTVLRVLEG